MPDALGSHDSAAAVRPDDPEQAHANDLAELESFALRLGFPVHDRKAHELFAEPLKLRALAPDLF